MMGIYGITTAAATYKQQCPYYASERAGEDKRRTNQEAELEKS